MKTFIMAQTFIRFDKKFQILSIHTKYNEGVQRRVDRRIGGLEI